MSNSSRSSAAPVFLAGTSRVGWPRTVGGFVWPSVVPNDAIFVRPYGVPGQVEPVFCNIRDDASVRAALAGADAVVNCVGDLRQGWPQQL